MGSRISEIEKLTFLGLHKSGMSINEISRRTGRSTDSVKQFVNDDVAESAFDQRSILTNEDMHKIFDLYSAGKRVTDISRQMNQPISTVGMVTRRLYPKHQKAYVKWLELQKHEEVSPALVMEVQTVESNLVPLPCKHQIIIDTQREIIENQKAIIANHEETINFLKEHIQLLKSLR